MMTLEEVIPDAADAASIVTVFPLTSTLSDPPLVRKSPETVIVSALPFTVVSAFTASLPSGATVTVIVLVKLVSPSLLAVTVMLVVPADKALIVILPSAHEAATISEFSLSAVITQPSVPSTLALTLCVSPVSNATLSMSSERVSSTSIAFRVWYCSSIITF